MLIGGWDAPSDLGGTSAGGSRCSLVIQYGTSNTIRIPISERPYAMCPDSVRQGRERKRRKPCPVVLDTAQGTFPCDLRDGHAVAEHRHQTFDQYMLCKNGVRMSVTTVVHYRWPIPKEK